MPCSLCHTMSGEHGPCVFNPQPRIAQEEDGMKFEVESLPDGQFLVRTGSVMDGLFKKVMASKLGEVLTQMESDPTPKKRTYPKGTRKRRTKEEIATSKAEATA